MGCLSSRESRAQSPESRAPSPEPRAPSPEQGFSLIESLLACALLTTAVLALVQLFGAATASNVASKHATVAAVLAAQKVEELRTAVAPAPGVDVLDAAGAPASAAAAAQPAGAVYVRRWTVDPLAADGGRSIVVQVAVAPSVGRGLGRREIRLISVRTPKAP